MTVKYSEGTGGAFLLRKCRFDTVYRGIHKTVKHFKNSQQIAYAVDRDNSYADRERTSQSFLK
jgi:hypothetical protein